MNPQVRVARDFPSLLPELGKGFVAVSKAAVEERGRFLFVLAGGSTPRSFYSEIARRHREDVDWGRTEVFWGDERCVPPDDPASNYAMAKVELLAPLSLPAERVHRIQGELGSEEAARRYAEEIRSVTGVGLPVFDLVLLGVGCDGHTASLFPRSAELREAQRAVVSVANSPDAPHVPRVSLTLPVLRAARRVWFLVTGPEKAHVVGQIFRSMPTGTPELPASMVHGVVETRWYLDTAAAQYLDPRPAGGDVSEHP